MDVIQKRHKIVVTGLVALDITPVFSNQNNYDSISDCFKPGTLLNVGEARFSAGGVVSNTGLALHKLGAEVTLLGKIGDDGFGRILQRLYREFGVGGLDVSPDASTSYSVVLAPPGIDRIFLHYPGANDTFVSADVPDSALEGAELLHFGYPPSMRSIYMNNGEELLKLFARAKNTGIRTSLDMAAIDPHGEAAKVNWPEFLSRILPLTDFFEPSQEEILFMLGNGITTAEEAARECFRQGAKTVLIKCGADGMYYKSAAEEGHQPCFSVPFVASATGAGDTSIAAFLFALLEGKTVQESAAYAAAEGACCVTSYDAFSGLKNMEELEQMIHSVS